MDREGQAHTSSTSTCTPSTVETARPRPCAATAAETRTSGWHRPRAKTRRRRSPAAPRREEIREARQHEEQEHSHSADPSKVGAAARDRAGQSTRRCRRPAARAAGRRERRRFPFPPPPRRRAVAVVLVRRGRRGPLVRGPLRRRAHDELHASSTSSGAGRRFLGPRRQQKTCSAHRPSRASDSPSVARPSRTTTSSAANAASAKAPSRSTGAIEFEGRACRARAAASATIAGSSPKFTTPEPSTKFKPTPTRPSTVSTVEKSTSKPPVARARTVAPAALGHLRRAVQAPQRRQRPLLQQEAHPERQRDEQEQVRGRHAAVREPRRSGRLVTARPGARALRQAPRAPPRRRLLCGAGPRSACARSARPVEPRVLRQVVLGLLRQRHAAAFAPPSCGFDSGRSARSGSGLFGAAAAALDQRRPRTRRAGRRTQAPRRRRRAGLLLGGAATTVAVDFVAVCAGERMVGLCL